MSGEIKPGFEINSGSQQLNQEAASGENYKAAERLAKELDGKLDILKQIINSVEGN